MIKNTHKWSREPLAASQPPRWDLGQVKIIKLFFRDIEESRLAPICVNPRRLSPTKKIFLDKRDIDFSRPGKSSLYPVKCQPCTKRRIPWKKCTLESFVCFAPYKLVVLTNQIIMFWSLFFKQIIKLAKSNLNEKFPIKTHFKAYIHLLILLKKRTQNIIFHQGW